MRDTISRLVRAPVVAIVVCVALAAGVAFGVVRLRDGDDLPDAPKRSADIVHDFAVAVTSLDYRRIDADIERVLAFGAESFRRDLGEVISNGFAEQATAAKRISVGEVVTGPTTQRLRDDRATLLVVVNQRIVSDGSEEPPQVVRVHMLVTVETDEEPLVTGVQVL